MIQETRIWQGVVVVGVGIDWEEMKVSVSYFSDNVIGVSGLGRVGIKKTGVQVVLDAAENSQQGSSNSRNRVCSYSRG
jgi:hypothetical protein